MKLRSGKQAYKHKYYNPLYPGSYAGLHSFDLPNVSRNKVAHYLSTQDTYTRHKPIVRRFNRRRVICLGKFVTLECDLIDTQKFKSVNSGVRYLLTVICCFSRFAFVRPLKNKKTVSVISQLRDILQHTKKRTRYICSDKGSEFYSKKMKEFLDTKNITLYSSLNKDIKGSLIERFNRTLQTRLYKYMFAHNTKKYTHILQDIVTSYNNTYHSSIGMQPANVNSANSEQIWHNLYPYQYRKKNKLYIGDFVRIPESSHIFSRGYTPNWGATIFIIGGINNTSPHTYSLINQAGNKIRKQYYDRELVKINYK
jgi:transposase InsO family protein